MSRKCNRPGCGRLGHAGVSTVEFAVVALLFLTVLIGCMDLGRYYLAEHSLRTVVAETARAALVDRSIDGSIDPTTASFVGITPFVDNADLTLTVTQHPNRPGVTDIMVTGSYTFTAYSPIWRSLDGTITETTELQDRCRRRKGSEAHAAAAFAGRVRPARATCRRRAVWAKDLQGAGSDVCFRKYVCMPDLSSGCVVQATVVLPRRGRPFRSVTLPTAWAFVIAWAAGAAAWSWRAEFRLVGAWHIVVIGTVLLLVSAAYRRRDRRVADMFEVTALWLAISLVGLLTTALMTRTAAPLVDSMLIAADARLGFSWPLWTGWVDSHPLLRLCLLLAYVSLLPQFALSLVYLPLTGRVERIIEMAVITVLALIPALLCVRFVPALGPFAAFGMTDQAMYLPTMLALRGGAEVFDISYNGAALVTFPSFHAIWALALVYIHRGNGRLTLAVATLNAAVLASVISEGGHYLVDLIAGVIVFAAVVPVARVLVRPGPERA